MIITRTPFRVTLGGGGTDLPSYYKNYGGFIFSFALNKYMFINVKLDFADDLIRVKYSESETVSNINEIKHDIARECLRKHNINKAIEIVSMADIPAGSGLGSSSSYTVGLLNALRTSKRDYISLEDMAEEACEIEIDILGRPIGKQDQYIAAYGGIREINFLSDNKVKVETIKIKSTDRLVFGSNLLLFYTDITRKSSDILNKQKADTHNKIDILKQIRDQVPLMREILECGPSYDEVGPMLHKTWELKKQITEKISNPRINKMYQKAREAGALGGKISGAGGGGFLLLYVPRDKQNKVREVLKEYREFPFMLNPDGSKIIFNVRRDYWK